MSMFEVVDEFALSTTSGVNITTGFAGLPDLFVVARATDQSSVDPMTVVPGEVRIKKRYQPDAD